ncbi:MAG TPA: translocation/assembly module TamB domain-containing protein [Bryobacteraceae bacterium]|nr:translocation/assembly module TamB domain-containing protein [Bryobacteraceae bacterium]
MRRTVRYILYGLAALASLAILVTIAGVIAVQTPWFHHLVRNRIVYEAEKATGGRVELRSFDFDWHTLTAEVRDFTLHGTESAGEAPLFRAASIRVGLKIISVFEKKVDLASVQVREPRVNVIVYEDGRTNLPKPKVPHRGRGTLQTVLDLAIKRFQVTGGTAQVQMRRFPLNALGENLRAQVFYQPAPARYRGEIGFRSLDVQAGGFKPLVIDVDTRLVLERDRLGIEAVHLASNGATVDVRGSVDHFASPRVELAYTARLDLAHALEDVRLDPFARRGTIAFGGSATLTPGSGYALTGKLQAAGLAFRERGVSIQNIRAASAVTITPERIEFADLVVDALHGRFAGRAEMRNLRTFRVDGAVRGLALQDATQVEGVHRMAWSGGVSGPLGLGGEVRNGKLAALRLDTRLSIEPAAGENPVRGLVDFSYDHAGRTLSFRPSEIDTRFSQIRFSGVLGREMKASVQSTNIDDARPAIAIFTTSPVPEMPVKLLNGGMARFDGVVTGPLRNPVISGHATATHFVTTGREFDRGEADAVVSRTGVTAHNAVLERGSLKISGSAQVAFRNWRPEPDQSVAGTFTVRAGDIQDALAPLKVTPPFEVRAASIAGEAKLSGTIGDPDVTSHVTASNIVLAGQPIDRVEGEVHYTDTALDVTRAQIDHGGSHAQVAARFDHAAGDWKQGRIRFRATSAGVLLDQLAAVQQRVSGIEGRIEAQISGELSVAQNGFRPGACNGWIAVRGLAVGGESLGSLLVNTETRGSSVDVRLSGQLAGSKVSGTSNWALSGDYPVHGHVDFTPLRFSTLLAKLRATPARGNPPFNGLVAGTLDFSGKTTVPESWKGTLRLPTVVVRPSSGFADVPNAPGLVLRNQEPVLVDLDLHGARVRQARFQGKDTHLVVGGRFGFGTRNPWDLRVQGGMDLALLRDFDSQINSAGSMVMDVSVRGALERPDVYGRIDLRKAAVNLANFPNGIDNANGVIFLYRDRATIETLTAESGGGKIAVSGFVSFAEVTTFHLQAKANDVRVRYPEGVSSTSDATLTFTGTTDRSVLAGDVTIMRVGFNPRSDLGTILANASQPIEAPAQPSRFRQGMRFDVRILTSPQVRFETKLTKDIQADASLRLRGNATHPVVLGRVMINQGDVMFFGNKYTINSGQILFVNATKIEPTVSLDLETRARGIEVTLHVSGPVNKLNVSYRSDPPLSFADIVALLTTGRQPGLTPGVSGTGSQSSQIGQNWQQAGASALVTQAIASPLTGRLQRFFGVSRLKIDPQLTGLTTNNAAARLTLEQNITNNLSFTYITDLSRAQAQTIRIEWDFTNNWSGVAEREENGQFGIDFLYRKQVK